MTRPWDMSRVRGLLNRLFTRPAVEADPYVVGVATGAMSVNQARTLRMRSVPIEVIDAPPTPAEVEQAMGWLYGYRPARRKFERTRTHITYRQRDEVAHVLARLSRAYEERTDG